MYAYLNVYIYIYICIYLIYTIAIWNYESERVGDGIYNHVYLFTVYVPDTIDSSNIQHQHLHVCIVSFRGTLQERLAGRRLTPRYHIISDCINYSFHVFTISGAFGVRDHWNPSMCFDARSCSLHKIWEIFVSPRALGNWLAIWCWLCSWFLILQQTWLSSIFLDIVGRGGTLQPQCCVRRIFSWRKSGGLSVGTLPRPTFFEATWTSLARSKRSSFKLFKRACIHPETSPKYSKVGIMTLDYNKVVSGRWFTTKQMVFVSGTLVLQVDATDAAEDASRPTPWHWHWALWWNITRCWCHTWCGMFWTWISCKRSHLEHGLLEISDKP